MTEVFIGVCGRCGQGQLLSVEQSESTALAYKDPSLVSAMRHFLSPPAHLLRRQSSSEHLTLRAFPVFRVVEASIHVLQTTQRPNNGHYRTQERYSCESADQEESVPLFIARAILPLNASHVGRSSSGGRKKLTPFNKFMQTETARLKEEQPDLDSKERYACMRSYRACII